MFLFGAVDEKIYNLKYRVSLQSWLIDFVVAQEGYDTCMKLEGACCYQPNQTITAQLSSYQGKKAIKFEGDAEGNCHNKSLTILIVGSSGDEDLTQIQGKYTFLTDISSKAGELQESVRQQFVLAIDDQQNLYMLKLPSLQDSYTDNNSYNYLSIQVATAHSIFIKFSIISLLLIFFF